MNINTLSDTIDLFNIEVVNSGFQRDIQNYINSLSSNQNNIIALTEIATKVYEKLESIYSGTLPEDLEKLLTTKVEPFTRFHHIADLNHILNSKEIQLLDFFQQLNGILSGLHTHIQQNINEITKIKDFIKPYVENQEKIQADENKAIISIIFKDIKTITNLKEFSKTIQQWNKVLPMYHQLLKSSSPEDIEIITVQNGSIDFLFNFDINIALDLTEVFKVGLRVFMAYLLYKKTAQPIVDGYFGNKKLIKIEKEKEQLLIDNIGEAIRDKILEQHKTALKKDDKIDINADKRIEQVEKLITSHILKGNDFKLLSLPAAAEEVVKEIDAKQKLKEDMRTLSTEVRQALKELPQAEFKMLQEKYDVSEEQ